MADLNIMKIDPETRRVTFALNLTPAKTSDIESLVQLCAKTILSTSGRDYLRKEYGGNLLSLRGSTLNSSQLPRLYADIAYIIRLSEELILKEQVDKLLKASERLKSLVLLNIITDLGAGTLEIDALVTSEAGESADFSFSTATAP
jgi:hypothetical protein